MPAPSGQSRSRPTCSWISISSAWKSGLFTECAITLRRHSAACRGWQLAQSSDNVRLADSAGAGRIAGPRGGARSTKANALSAATAPTAIGTTATSDGARKRRRVRSRGGCGRRTARSGGGQRAQPRRTGSVVISTRGRALKLFQPRQHLGRRARPIGGARREQLQTQTLKPGRKLCRERVVERWRSALRLLFQTQAQAAGGERVLLRQQAIQDQPESIAVRRVVPGSAAQPVPAASSAGEALSSLLFVSPARCAPSSERISGSARSSAGAPGRTLTPRRR